MPLPARPTHIVSLPESEGDLRALASLIRKRVDGMDRDAVVRIRHGDETPLTAAFLRELVPPTMNIELGPRTVSRKRKGALGPFL